jgi:hypothetical protein
MDLSGGIPRIRDAGDVVTCPVGTRRRDPGSYFLWIPSRHIDFNTVKTVSNMYMGVLELNYVA